MRISTNKINWVDVVLLVIIASLSFMFIPAWLPLLRKGWQLLMLASALILVFRHNSINQRAVIALFLYSLVVVLNAMSGDLYIGSPANAIYDMMMLFVSSSLAFYCTVNGNLRFVKVLITITFIALLFEMVASFIVLEVNPGLIRGLYSMAKQEGDVSLMYEYYRMGIMDYNMAHALPLLIPSLICRYKEGRVKEKVLFALLIAVCILLTWLSESATALMLILLMVFLGVLVSAKASFRKQAIIITIMSLLTVALLSNDFVLGGIFDTAEVIVGDESIYAEKIEELRLSFMEDQTIGDMEGRFDRYGQSARLFFDNIFLGSNQMPGRHSSLLDKLGTLGLIGFIPLMLFFINQIKAIWRTIVPSRRVYYLECVIAAFLMLLFKGMWVWPIFFFLFMLAPSLLIMPQTEK